MRRPSHFIVPMVVFGMGLSIGSWVAINKRANEFSAGVERRIADGRHNLGTNSAPAKMEFANEQEMITAIMSAVSEQDALPRAYQLRRLISSLDSEQLKLMFGRAIQVVDPGRRKALLEPLLARWLGIDAAAAKAAIQPYLDRARAAWRMDLRSAEVSIMEAWAKAMPVAALAEAVAAPDAWWAWSIGRSSLDALTNGDPEGKIVELSKLPGSKLRDGLIDEAIGALAEKDYAAAEARLSLISDPRKRSERQTDIISKLAERDPSAAMNRMIDLAPSLAFGQPGFRLVGKVLRAAAEKNGLEALAIVDQLPVELRNQARGAALVGWAAENPIGALDWAMANDVKIEDAKVFNGFSEYGAGWNSLISAAFENDREKTMNWLRALPPSAERDSLLAAGIWRGSPEQRSAIYAEMTPEYRKKAIWAIINAYNGTGVSEAQSWVKALPEGAERVAGVQALAALQMENFPDRAESIIEEWPSGSERDAALRGIANAISDSDSLGALQFARRISNSTVRSNAFAIIAASWLSQNEAAARAWLAGTTEIPADERRVLIREFEER